MRQIDFENIVGVIQRKQRFDKLPSMALDGALIDRPFVSRFTVVERRRRIEEGGADNQETGGGIAQIVSGQRLVDLLSNNWMTIEFAPTIWRQASTLSQASTATSG